jgi:hypothetical protein
MDRKTLLFPDKKIFQKPDKPIFLFSLLGKKTVMRKIPMGKF